VADIAICVGVGLMAVDMFTSKRRAGPPVRRKPKAEAKPAEPPLIEALIEAPKEHPEEKPEEKPEEIADKAPEPEAPKGS